MTIVNPFETDDDSFEMEVKQLTSESTGRWLVATQGSEHWFDLDARTYTRIPGPGSATFEHDVNTGRLTIVDRWPQVGNTFLITFDDPDFPKTREHWRQSSTIRSIRRLGPAD